MVEPLPPVFGALFNDSNIELRCRVECSPECSVEWYRTHPDKGSYSLVFDPLYTIEVGRKPRWEFHSRNFDFHDEIPNERTNQPTYDSKKNILLKFQLR